MTTSSAKPTRWIMVPADARFDICPCGKRQYWVHTRTGKPMPVDCDVEGGKRPLIVRQADGDYVRAGGQQIMRPEVARIRGALQSALDDVQVAERLLQVMGGV